MGVYLDSEDTYKINLYIKSEDTIKLICTFRISIFYDIKIKEITFTLQGHYDPQNDSNPKRPRNDKSLNQKYFMYPHSKVGFEHTAEN